MTVRITGIAGSLRRESFNRKLLSAAAYEMPPGAELMLWDGLGAVAPFSEDLESRACPAGRGRVASGHRRGSTPPGAADDNPLPAAGRWQSSSN